MRSTRDSPTRVDRLTGQPLQDTRRVDEPVTGFPGIAHGGYLGGLLAARLGPSVAVTLRRPLALGSQVGIAPTETGTVLRDAEGVVAEGAAEAASRGYRGHG